MRLLAVGLSHRTAPVELRESVDFARAGLDRALHALAERGVSPEAVVLSTCNRAEIYAVGDSDAAADAITGFFCDYHGLDPARLAAHLYCHRGVDAARHLFRVAAGLDSLVVGEPQILGQVKTAYATASDLHFTGTVTHRLFHAAFAVGKRVRHETGLAEGAVSVSYAAIELAKKIFGDLSGLSVLILGAGEMAELTGVHLRAQRVKQITIASRTLASAETLARQLEGRAVPWQDLRTALAAADIVVTATGAAEPVLTRATVEEAMRSRRDRPLFVIDIALPRDVETSVGDLDQVFLYHMDDLQSIVSENLARRTTRARERGGHRRSGGRAVCLLAPVARDRADDCGAAAALREHPPGRAAPPRAQARRPDAGGTRARRRGDAPARREAAAHADRAPEDRRRRHPRRRLRRGAAPAVRTDAAQPGGRTRHESDGERPPDAASATRPRRRGGR